MPANTYFPAKALSHVVKIAGENRGLLDVSGGMVEARFGQDSDLVPKQLLRKQIERMPVTPTNSKGAHWAPFILTEA